MKVHPVVPRRRNITIQNDIVSSNTRQDKLRRLPHIFAKVLELPFHSDADVSIEETSDLFRFIIPTTDDYYVGDNVTTHVIEIYPGVTKIVIRGGNNNNNVFDLSFSDLDLDLWRFRLPAATLPELASAGFSDGGDLVVTVPKGVEDGGDGGGLGGGGAGGRLVLVQ